MIRANALIDFLIRNPEIAKYKKTNKFYVKLYRILYAYLHEVIINLQDEIIKLLSRAVIGTALIETT